MKLQIFPGIEELNNFAAEKIVEIAAEAVEKRGQFTAALAGGSTPKALYRLLASDKFRDKIDWQKVFFFFGDERNVPPDNKESNYRMANENLFEPLKIDAANIFRWRTELNDAEKITEDYKNALRNFFDAKNNPPAHAGATDKFPRFDLILLG